MLVSHGRARYLSPAPTKRPSSCRGRKQAMGDGQWTMAGNGTGNGTRTRTDTGMRCWFEMLALGDGSGNGS